ncbi:MAG: D-alanyl-D-alanine carboxypeptidase family protein [Oscillospiraceae bacterium]|nr:D-alanyl-D-alanine carboxypeptidase family protein [Oscillospiraceae bacterium]
MWSKLSRRKFLLLLAALLALAALTAVLLIPYAKAKNTMDPGGRLTFLTLSDGTVQLQWPEGSNANGYEVQVREKNGAVLYSTTVAECTALLPQLPSDRELEVGVTSLRKYDGGIRKGRENLSVTVTQPSPQIRGLHWQADDVYDTVDVSFDMSAGDLCRVYLSVDGAAPVLAEEVRDGSVQLRFGVDDVFAVPEYGQQIDITFQLERTTDSGFYQGAVTEGFTLTREDLLGRKLKVEHSYNGNNSYTFTWNESKGEYYDVRLSEDGGETWMTIAYIPVGGERSFTTRGLTAFTEHLVQVVAVGGQTMEGSDLAAESDLLPISTGERFLYSTIWPIMDRKVYAAPDGTGELGKIPAGSAWCVLGQEGRYLKICYNGQDAYVDGDYCMINLTEYLGNLCAYDITNSYRSIYLVHEYGIPDVSGTIITGYENVRIKEGEYLVPLLFPAAQKLMKAGLAAKAQGYTLKIYDSFRPQYATDSIYWKTYSVLGWPIPEHTYSGKPAVDTYGNVQEFASGSMSYRRLMTNSGSWELSAFLAPGTSRHNFGVALDLTLVDENGKELSMQTSMHDLSWYSAQQLNNGNAMELYRIMTGAGFRSISSEWWHYQDNEIYDKHLYAPLKTGVSYACWVMDGNGWRYRLNDGSFYANCTQIIEEQSYTFDESGYLIQSGI